MAPLSPPPETQGPGGNAGHPRTVSQNRASEDRICCPFLPRWPVPWQIHFASSRLVSTWFVVCWTTRVFTNRTRKKMMLPDKYTKASSCFWGARWWKPIIHSPMMSNVSVFSPSFANEKAAPAARAQVILVVSFFCMVEVGSFGAERAPRLSREKEVWPGWWVFCDIDDWWLLLLALLKLTKRPFGDFWWCCWSHSYRQSRCSIAKCWDYFGMVRFTAKHHAMVLKPPPKRLSWHLLVVAAVIYILFSLGKDSFRIRLETKYKVGIFTFLV